MENNHNWGARTINTGSPFEQGMVIDEDSPANIAVVYDSKHTKLLAAAPELLRTLESAIACIESSYDEVTEATRDAMRHDVCSYLGVVNDAKGL